MCSIVIFPTWKSCRLWDNVENMAQPDRPHIDSVKWRIPLSVLDNRGYRHASNTKYLLLFQDNSGYTNAPQCYVCTYLAYLVILGLMVTYGERHWCLKAFVNVYILTD